MADESSTKPEGVVAGPPPVGPAAHGDDGAIVAGAPPAAPSEIAAGAPAASFPDIVLPSDGGEPTRTCARCGSPMAVCLRENVLLNGIFPTGQRIYFRCLACGKQIKIRNSWRLCLVSIGCLFFCAMFWCLFPFDRWPFAVFMLLLALYPATLVLEFITRMRYPKTGSNRWVRRVIWAASISALIALTLKAASEAGPRLTTGASALAAMSPVERKFHDEVFSRINHGTTRQQVMDLLGPPAENVPMSWNAPGHKDRVRSKVTVEFDDFRTFKVLRATWQCRTGFFTGFYCELPAEEKNDNQPRR